MRQRIHTIDGLRFLAAIGVLWIHAWTVHGNPRFYIGKIDFADLLAIGGNGVDLFFVISGFCIYYFYGKKSDFSFHDFRRFLVKRWVRLSPAFYIATILYILAEKFVYHDKIDGVPNFLHSLFYLNILYGQYSTASHFWTLTVEWQFYFIIPFAIICQNKTGFIKALFITFGMVSVATIVLTIIFKNHTDELTATILFRGVEFGCGTIAARLLMKSNQLIKNRILWLISFIVIIYAGRVLVSGPVLSLSYYYYNLFKLAGFTLMGAGFAGVLYLAVTSVKWLNLILGNIVFKKIGRISYSFYLLHGLVFHVVAAYTMQFLPNLRGITAPVLTTCISAAILFPVSLLSYNLLEKPFLSIGNLTTK